MDMEETKKNEKYDGIALVELETKIEKLRIESRESQREMYECLEYLRTSYRYKENTRYKKASFWQYLEDRFNIRQGTFRENVRSFTKFPQYSVEYGVGLVAKIDRICGGIKVDKVISEIKEEATSRKNGVPIDKIESIIQKNRSTKKIKKEITDWKAMYETERQAHDKTKEALKFAMGKIKELNEQVAKLKVTATKWSRIRDVFEDRPRERIATM